MADNWNTDDLGNGNVFGADVKKFKVSFVADADGSVEGKLIPMYRGFFLGVRLIYGATPPLTGATDIKIVDSEGVDLLGGDGADLTTSAGGTTDIDASKPKPFVGGLTIKISDNTTDSAAATVVVYAL